MLHFWLGFKAFFFHCWGGRCFIFWLFWGVFVWWTTEADGEWVAQIPDGHGGDGRLSQRPQSGVMSWVIHSSRLWLLIYPHPLMMLPFPLLQLWLDERFDSKHGWLFMPSSTGFMSAVVEYWCFIKLKMFNFEHCNSRFEREDHDFPRYIYLIY